MTGPAPESRGADMAEARDAWLEVSDGLLAGIGHALNNRVAALTAVGQVLAATTEGPLSSALSSESSRMQRAVQLLRLLVRRWHAEPEPVQLEDVLADVAELLSHHPDVRSTAIRVEAAPGLAPVWTERSSLTHAFCLLLTPIAEAAERAAQEAVTVRCSSTVEEVRIEIPFPAGSEHDLPGRAGAPDPHATRALLERAGGTLSTQKEAGVSTGLLVRLPTLMEVRRREREG